MAQTAVRLHLRRAFSLSTALLHHSAAAAAAVNSVHPHTPLKSSSAVPRRNFHSSLSLAFAAAPRSFDDIDKIDPNAILFEGCDYNHWLIVMDFGKDPTQHPPPQQMVETYVQTAAQILGSVEEAKRKIYACSTSTYTGFQVLVDEETAKKFEGLPGVIFVLPDSYIDPVNKEYGGDKYINGEIIHRPAPIAYGRSNRNYRSNDRRPSPPNQQGNPAYIQSGTMPQGGRDYTPSSPQQGSNDRRPSQPNQQGNPAYNQSGPMPQGGSGYTPSAPQQGIPQQQNLPPQQNYPPQPPSYAPPPQNYGPPGQAHGVPQYSGGGVGGYQGGQRNFAPPQQGNFNSPQGPVSNAPGNHGSPPPPGQYRANIPPPVAGAPGQAAGGSFPQGGPGAGYPPPLGGNQRFPQGSYGQNNPMGTRTPYNQAPPSGNTYGHGAGYPPPPPPGQNQRFPPTSNEQGNPMESGNYPPGAQTGFNQRRY